MCLSKPYKIIKIDGDHAMVEFQGSRKLMNTGKQKLNSGDYVLCQSGFIVKKITKEQANEITKEWASFS